MLDINNDWLPIGTIVRLTDADRAIMIDAHLAVEANTKTVFDYCGCPFPNGRQALGDLFFNRYQIEEVISVGFLNQESIQYLAKLDKHVLDLKAKVSANEE